MQTLPPGPRLTPMEFYTFLRKPFVFFEKNRSSYGDLFRVVFPGKRVVVYAGAPEAVKAIFEKDREGVLVAGDAGGFAQVFGEHSIVVTERATHVRQRRLLLPSFHGDRMKAYGEVMQQHTRHAVRQWSTGARVNVLQQMMEISLGLTTAAILGVREPGAAKRVQEAVRTVIGAVSPMLMFFRASRIDFGGVSPWGRFLRARRHLDALMLEEIRQRRSTDAAGEDILSLMMAARYEDGAPMSDAELLDQLATLFALGHESTATAMSWAIYAVLSRPPILERLHDEIDALGADPDPASLVGLRYLDATCKETLRCHTVVPELRRRMLTTPWTLMGFDLPAGTFLAPAVYLVHQNPSVYADPEVFRPDRFLDRTFRPHEFMPFGGGARRCIGDAFALYEMTIVLGTIFSSVDLRLAPDQVVWPKRYNLAIGPSNGVEILSDGPRRAARTARAFTDVKKPVVSSFSGRPGVMPGE